MKALEIGIHVHPYSSLWGTGYNMKFFIYLAHTREVETTNLYPCVFSWHLTIDHWGKQHVKHIIQYNALFFVLKFQVVLFLNGTFLTAKNILT